MQDRQPAITASSLVVSSKEYCTIDSMRWAVLCKLAYWQLLRDEARIHPLSSEARLRVVYEGRHPPCSR